MFKFLKRKKRKIKNKKLVFIFGAVILVTAVSFISYALSQSSDQVILDISLSSDNYDPVTKTFFDRSGFGNHGVSVNNVSFTEGMYGGVDGAMIFNGTSDYIEFGNTLNMGLKDMSISIWAKRDLSDRTGYFVTKSLAGGLNNRYWVSMQASGVVRFGASWNNGDHTDYLGSKYIPEKEWTNIFISIKRDGYLKIFIDGELDSSYNVSNYSSLNVVSNIPFRIGAYTAGDNITPQSFFSGQISQVKIFNYALSGKEIENLYNSEKSISTYSPLHTDGLVAHWSMDKDSYVEGTRNFVKNPTGILISNSVPGNYQPGWDPALHNDAIVVSSWSSGYNSGVDSPTIGYHAKWVYEGIDGNKDPCIKFVDRNDEYGLGHRWLGVSQTTMGTPKELGLDYGDKVTVSWHQKVDTLNRGARLGLYHTLLSTGTTSFENNHATILGSKVDEWERVSFTTTIGTDWDLNKQLVVYVYSAGTAYGTTWVDNIQVEKKDHATPFSIGTRQGSIVDRSVYSNHGYDNQNQSFTFTEDRFGKEGGAMSFDGSGTIDGVIPGNNIVVPESATDTRNCLNGCAYSFWIKVDENATDRMSLFFGAEMMRHIEIYSSGKKFRTEAGVENGYSFGTGVFPDDVRGVWSHFVIVFAENKPNRPVYWYQNGKLFHTGKMTGGTNPDTEYFSFNNIGRSTGTVTYNYAKSFHGAIDDVRIYNRALSEEEIIALYDSYSPVTTTGSLQKGLILDMPLKLNYTKSETPGSQIMTNRSVYFGDGQNQGATITDEGAIFPAVNDGIYLGNGNKFFPLPKFSVCAWIKTPGLAPGMSGNGIFSMTYGLRMYLHPTSGFFNFGLDEGEIAPTLIVPINLYDNKYHHVCVSHDGTSKRMFLDGELKNSINSPWLGFTRWPTSRVEIGRDVNSQSSKFNGLISNLLIYNRALSENEVKALYDRGRSDAGIIFQTKE